MHINTCTCTVQVCVHVHTALYVNRLYVGGCHYCTLSIPVRPLSIYFSKQKWEYVGMYGIYYFDWLPRVRLLKLSSLGLKCLQALSQTKLTGVCLPKLWSFLVSNNGSTILLSLWSMNTLLLFILLAATQLLDTRQAGNMAKNRAAFYLHKCVLYVVLLSASALITTSIRQQSTNWTCCFDSPPPTMAVSLLCML